MDNFAYGASKAAVHFLTKNLALRLGPKGVTVNAIAPGAFQSNMMNATLEKFQDKIESENPLGRIGAPEDMAGLALYLASNASKYMTGGLSRSTADVTSVRDRINSTGNRK